MTEKAKKILQKMNRRQALKRLANPERRNRILNEFNRNQMDDAGPLRGDKGEKHSCESSTGWRTWKAMRDEKKTPTGEAGALAPRVDGRWIVTGDLIARNPRILFRLTLFGR